MDGVTIAWRLLKANAGVLALVPQAQIVSGVAPPNTPLEAISITRVSEVDRNIPSPGTNRRATERVQVTVLARDYPKLRAAIAAAKKALADFVGTVGSINDVTIQTDLAGPDFMDEEASIYFGTQDFIVGYTEPR
jgi:hypothetical protein